MLSNRFRFCAVLLVAFFISPLANAAPHTLSWWRITFDPPPPSWHRSDAQKILRVKVTNVTDHVAWVFESNSTHDYQVAITDSRGKFVPMTAAGLQEQKGLRSALDRAMIKNVPPGGSQTSEINLADFYDLSPGKYAVKATLRSITEDAVDEKTNHRKPNAPPEPSGSTTIEITP